MFSDGKNIGDIMVREKQIPFRTAHKIVGRIVNEATSNNMAEEDITSRFIDDIAVELGSIKCANIILIGALIGADAGIITEEAMLASLAEKFGSKKKEVLEDVQTYRFSFLTAF